MKRMMNFYREWLALDKGEFRIMALLADKKQYTGYLSGICRYFGTSSQTKQLCEIIELVKSKSLRLMIVGSITLDCREGHADPMSEAFLQMAGVFSQLELAMIRARVKSGMANAKAKGAKIGRPQLTADNIPANFYRHYPAYKSGQLNLSEFARVCDLSRTTIYKYISLLE